jgi:hypothetical protein
LLPRLLVPQVVLLLVSGIVIAPHVVGLGTSGRVQVLADVGLQFVFLPVALGMTTTALGTLLPMLRERDLLHGRLERYQSSSPMLRCPQEQGRAFTQDAGASLIVPGLAQSASNAHGLTCSRIRWAVDCICGC